MSLPGPPAPRRELRKRGLRIVGPGLEQVPGSALRPNLVLAGELAEPADVVLLSVKATALDQASLTSHRPSDRGPWWCRS